MSFNIDMSRRNKEPRPLKDSERARLEEFIDSIHYSARYSDDEFEYRHVQLPKTMLKAIPKDYHDSSKGTLKLLWEDEWRAIGITQSLGWEHYEVHEPEPHILLFKATLTMRPAQYQCDHPNQTFSQISPKAIVSDACASYSTLEKLNRRVKPAVDDLTKNTDFFAYYRLNLFNKKCPFWNDENGMCGNIACAVQTLENEEDIPETWRASELGKLKGPHAEHPGKKAQEEKPFRPLQGRLGENVGESCIFECDDECDERDYCVPEDESASAKGDYVSLVHNPERFTGYGGEGAKMVWDAIYRENCFMKSSFPHASKLGAQSLPNGPAAFDFRQVLKDADRKQLVEQHLQNPDLTLTETAMETEDECLEKRVFYRVISGMHASISTHLCYDFLNQSTGEWQPNVQCYIDRLHTHPERISNLYFNYALVTRAIAKLGPQLSSYTFCTGDPDQDAATKANVLAVTQGAASVPEIFDESLMFKNGEGPSLKEDFRNRFRNVSRIMDCVGCDKCRLWGKIQTNGYGTALKVLFEFDNDSKEIPQLKRTELVALFNTYGRLSHSMEALSKFRDLVDMPAESQTQTKPVSDETNVAEPLAETKPDGEAPVQEDWEERQEEHPRRPKTDDESSHNDATEELERIMKVLKFIFKGWFNAPKTFWYIISTEFRRFGQGFLGLPVSPRSWKWGLDREAFEDL
ncbi:oxidoreductin [Microdochium trichocladiopsis]|uniref:Cyclin-dependent kinases regulatory subunit n=1 Tax=Microdochium trichocladiopsis TaxID=1682393 RepID=A0A9P8Y2T6_9PEZI|nr:oxidoreductin [Microdochium trichocladiopsis]KAH7027434.1 oxidoreductin [Microdochium trichocladiopsis]